MALTQERLVSDVDQRGQGHVVVAAVAVDAGERELRVDIADALVTREARSTEWLLGDGDVFATGAEQEACSEAEEEADTSHATLAIFVMIGIT